MYLFGQLGPLSEEEFLGISVEIRVFPASPTGYMSSSGLGENVERLVTDEPVESRK